MDPTNKKAWKVWIAALSLFLLGFVAGALTLSLYRSQNASASLAHTQKRFKEMLNQLNLTAQQRTEIDQIILNTRTQLVDVRRSTQPQFREIRKQTRARIEAVLTPEQKRQFQQMLNEHRSERRRAWSLRPNDQ